MTVDPLILIIFVGIVGLFLGAGVWGMSRGATERHPRGHHVHD
jgi:hypothetical protein